MFDSDKKNKRSKFGQFKPRKIIKPEMPLEYKNVDYLSKFIGPTGKLQSRRRTGFDGQDQRKLAAAVKLARFMGLLPYVGSTQGDGDRDSRGGGRDRFSRDSRGPRQGRGEAGAEAGSRGGEETKTDKTPEEA